MGLFSGGGGGFLGSVGGAISNATSSLGDALRPIQQATLALPGIAATGQNYLLQSGIQGAGTLLQNPQALASIAGGVATGGASTGISGLLGGLGSLTGGATSGGDYGMAGMLASLLGGNKGSGGVSVSVPQSSAALPLPTPTTGKVPVWVWIAGGVAAVGVLVLSILLMRRGRK